MITATANNGEYISTTYVQEVEDTNWSNYTCNMVVKPITGEIYPLSTNTSTNLAIIAQEPIAATDTIILYDGTSTKETVATGITLNNASINVGSLTNSTKTSGSLATYETLLTAFTFNPTGTKIYIVGTGSDNIREYSLSTAWDISSMAATPTYSINISSFDTTTTGIAFNSDGTKLYHIGYAADVISQRTLDTPWSLATSTYNNSSQVLGFNPTGLEFSIDGKYFYTANYTNTTIAQYSMEIPWDITSKLTEVCTYGNLEIVPISFTITKDGRSIIIINNSGLIYQYTLNTAWDLNSIVTAYSYSKQMNTSSSIAGISLGDAESKLYYGNTSTDLIYQWSASGCLSKYYTLNVTSLGLAAATSSIFIKERLPTIDTSFDTSYGSLVRDLTIRNAYTSYSLIDSYVSSTTTQLVFNTYDRIYDANANDILVIYSASSPAGEQVTVSTSTYTDTTPTNISSATYASKTIDLDPDDLVSWFSLAFNASGTKVFVMNNSVDSTHVHEYTMTTAWDISTVNTTPSYTYNIPTYSTEATYRYIKFNDTGTKMYIYGATLHKIYQFSLSTAWSLSSATFAGAVSGILTVSSSTTNFAFNTKGTKLYVLETSTDLIKTYDLSIPWEIRSAAYLGSTDISAAFVGGIYAMDLAFNYLGTKIYLVDSAADSIRQGNLPTPWDISSITSDSISDSISAQLTDAQAIAFDVLGTKYYVINYSTGSIYQYDVNGSIHTKYTTTIGHSTAAAAANLTYGNPYFPKKKVTLSDDYFTINSSKELTVRYNVETKTSREFKFAVKFPIAGYTVKSVTFNLNKA